MRKTLSLILALVLAFSLAAVPAFAADTTEAETSTSDTAYGQLHNGLLSEILRRIDIANDDIFIHGIVGVNIKDLVDHIGSDSNFVHGIVRVTVGDLFKDIASNNNYMHGIITITGYTVNINFGQVIGDIAAGGANSETTQQALAEILKAVGMTQTGINAILTGIAGSILTNDQIAQLLSQLISSVNMNLKNIVTIICALYSSRTITLQQAMTLLEKYISQMGNNSGSGTGTEPAQSTRLLDTTNHNAYVSGRTATTFVPDGTLTRAEAAKLLYELMTAQAHKQYDRGDNGFSDVPAGKWYAVAVNTLANAGAIKGYSNGTFQPGKPITRAEFVTILTGIYGANTSKGMPFADVGSAWCHDAVATAYANGWVGGYADGTFHPNQTITRAEAVTILNRVLGRSCDLTFVQANVQAASHFTDVTLGAWYYAAVTEVSVGHTFTELTGIERWTALA